MALPSSPKQWGVSLNHQQLDFYSDHPQTSSWIVSMSAAAATRFKNTVARLPTNELAQSGMCTISSLTCSQLLGVQVGWIHHDTSNAKPKNGLPLKSIRVPGFKFVLYIYIWYIYIYTCLNFMSILFHYKCVYIYDIWYIYIYVLILCPYWFIINMYIYDIWYIYIYVLILCPSWLIINIYIYMS